MKKIFIILLLISSFVIAQTIENLDFVSPLHDGVAAINKNNSWGFIDDRGNIIVAFRDDLVLTKTDDLAYPIFKNDRCLISAKKDGITYFGYIDKTGKTVVEPIFLNASNFDNNIAIVLHVLTKTVGQNDILKKPVVTQKYFEVTIDKKGNIKDYLNPKGTTIVLDKKYLLVPPKITSKKISNHAFVTLSENKKWAIVTTNN